MNKQCECWAKWNSRVNELSVDFLQVYSEKGGRGAGIESSLRRNTSYDQKSTVSPKICKVALLKRSIESAKTALDPNESDLRLRNKDMDQFVLRSFNTLSHDQEISAVQIASSFATKTQPPRITTILCRLISGCSGNMGHECTIGGRLFWCHWGWTMYLSNRRWCPDKSFW